MSEEREAALDLFFEGASRPRSAQDAVVMVTDALDRLIAALDEGSALCDEHGTTAREAADRGVREAAVDLGCTAVHAMRGLIDSQTLTDVAMPRRQAMVADAPPLDVGWQRQEDSYAALGAIATAQRDRLLGLAQQPYQLYRRLHDSVALAADASAWSAWVDV